LTTSEKDFKVKNGLIVADGGTFGGPVVIPEPTEPNQAVNKGYVDFEIGQIRAVIGVFLATTENIDIATDTLANEVLDGFTLESQMKILIKDQTDTSENGIYIITESGPAIRDLNYDDAEKINAGDIVYVENGISNYQSGWVLLGNVVTLDEDPLNYSKIFGPTFIQDSIGAGNGITVTPSATETTISIDSSVVATLSGAGQLDSSITSSSLTSVGTLSSLNISGSLDIAEDLDVVGDTNLVNTNITGTASINDIDVSGDATLVNLDVSEDTSLANLDVSGIANVNSLNVSGEADFSDAITIIEPTGPTNPATKAYVDALLDQDSVEIKTIDDLSNYFNGYNSRFQPTYQGIPVTLQNPFNLLLTIDGIIQSVGYPDYVWQSVMPRVGFRIDNDGYIAFPEAVPVGSTFDARILVGSATTTQTKVYPFKAMDIVLGGY